MKDYVGKKVKGFKFKGWTDDIAWNEGMEAYIGRVGQVLRQTNKYVIVEFDSDNILDDNTWTYPISLIEEYLVVEDQQLTIDKELKDLMTEFLSWKKEKEEETYKERQVSEVRREIIEQSVIYASNYFDMHETNNYKALQQGFEAGAKWGIAQQNK
jgi:hypothetical protein